MSQFPYDSRQIANWFIRRAKQDGASVSIMKVLKLVYMAHGWCLAALDRPLIMDRIEAWDYGPVIPAVYYGFRNQGVHDLSEFHMDERDFEPKVTQLLNEVWDLYKTKTAIQLSNLTHLRGGPWDQVYGRGNRFKGIPDDLIAEHYRAKLETARNG